MYADGAYPIPPTDSKVLKVARLQVRSRGGKPISTTGSWSKADTPDEIIAFWDLQQQAVNGLMPWAVWELFAFNVGASPTIVNKTPTPEEIKKRKAVFLSGNNRAAETGAPLPVIRKYAKYDALRSAFTQQTWPWRIPVSTMDRMQLVDKQTLEELLVDECWRRSLKYTTATTGMLPQELLIDMIEVREMIRTKFPNII
jgi:hypothetical protein